MASKTVNIPDMSCMHCLGRIKTAAEAIEGVAKVEGDVASKDVTVEFNAPATWEAVEQALKDAGYPPK